MGEHGRRQQAELFPRQVPAGPGHLGAGEVTSGGEACLDVLDGTEHKEIRSFVELVAPGADARQDVGHEREVVHAGSAR